MAKTKMRPAPARRKARQAAPRSRASTVRRADGDLDELKARLRDISDLAAANAVLSWDQATYMPSASAAARGRQSALLSRFVHERRTDPALGRLIDRLARHAETLAPDSDDARLIAVVRRDFDKAVRVPPEFMARFTALGAVSYDAWTRARPANDFAAVQPHLEGLLEMSRAYAQYFAPYDHVADPLIDDATEGMTYAKVSALFADLRSELVPIAQAICDQAAADDSCLIGEFPEERQLDFGLAIAKSFGYDLGRGRQDKSPHPFCTKFSADDVRITTRVKASDLTEALFSTLHEAGHAMYEQGVARELADSPLGWGASLGVHESQSRLWENLVGRSRGFWQHYYPSLQRAFSQTYGKVPLEAFYRAINKVARSLIRTDADEVTYNLHIILRFHLENAMLEGRLGVKDLPEAWRARYQSDLGIAPPDDRDGCLQDVHWYGSGVGGCFHSYTVGNILSAQFFAAALRAHPQIDQEIGRGEFSTLHGWLAQNLYRHGRKYLQDEIVRRATGEEISIRPYLGYLRQKYGELYRLP
jgi:carboxypeptidase Taq